MRILSWNIRAGGGRRVDGIERQIQKWAPDVVALSEYRGTPPSQRLAKNLRETSFRFQLETTSPRSPAVNSLLVASRWPICRLVPRATPKDFNRWLLVEVLAPTPFTLGVMHVPNRVSGRKRTFMDAVLELARTWNCGPALFVGDTNSGRIGLDEESSTFNKNEDCWMADMEQASWYDAFRYIHGSDRVYTWYSPNRGNGFRLDQGFVHQSMTHLLVEARYHWGGDITIGNRRDILSDHAALVLDFKKMPIFKN